MQTLPLTAEPLAPLAPGDGNPTPAAFRDGGAERERTITRYRRLREIQRRHADEIVGRLGRKTLLDWGKRIGLARRRIFVADSFEELTLVFDLAVYAARPGKRNAAERHRRNAGLAGGSEAAAVLDAMCRSRFSLFEVARRHEMVGVVLEDLLRGGEVWLIDSGLEVTAAPGTVLAARVIEPGPFHMTTGTLVVLDAVAMAAVAVAVCVRKGDAGLTDGTDVKLVEAVYRIAIEQRLMEKVAFL